MRAEHSAAGEVHWPVHSETGADAPSPEKKTMRTAICGTSGIELVDAATPDPGPDDVQVRVRAAALNRADLGMAAGQMHGSQGGPGTPLGMEWAGEITAIGANVATFSVGDRVMGSGRGAFSEFAVADHGRVSRLPTAAMSFETAATLPVALQTMHDALVTNGRLKAGDAVLIQGASAGVGIMGLLIARELGARIVIGSSTNTERRARLAEFGAQVAIDTLADDWPDQVREASGGNGVDLIVDQLSGSAINGNLKAAAIQGRIVNVGRLAGTHGDFDFDLHALKRVQYIGVTFRTRTVAEVRDVVNRMRADLWPAVEAGRLSLPIAARYPFDRIRDAFALMTANRHFGKIVLSFD
jgi:NADPH2:quinone reductase